MSGTPNEEKSNSDFTDWLARRFAGKSEELREYLQQNYIPQNVYLTFSNFEQFFTERKKLMREKLTSILPRGVQVTLKIETKVEGAVSATQAV